MAVTRNYQAVFGSSSVDISQKDYDAIRSGSAVKWYARETDGDDTGADAGVVLNTYAILAVRRKA